MKPLQRYVAGRLELRAKEDGSQPTLVGYAAVFGERTKIGNKFYERIESGAFTRAISEQSDVVAVMNHDLSQLLARTSNQTLRLSQDSRGLRVEIDPIDTNVGVDAVKYVKRGDIAGMSFSFNVRAGGQRFEEQIDGLPSRVITDVDLVDVSLVAFPAYETTAIEARAKDEAAEFPAPEAPADTRASMTPQEGEEAAELVQYQTAGAALAQASTALATAAAIVAGLISAETESPTETVEAEAAEEELETAQLRSLLVLCGQICGAVGGVSALAQAMLSDEYDPILWARSAAVADEDRARRLRLASHTGRAR